MHIAKAEKYLDLMRVVWKLKQALIIGCKGEHYDNQCLFLYAGHIRTCYGTYFTKCAVKPLPLGMGFTARPPNLRKQLKVDKLYC